MNEENNGHQEIKAPPTHIVTTYVSQNVEMLFRASDGMTLGQRKGNVVVYGESPNKKDSRVFIDKEHASKFLRERVPWLCEPLDSFTKVEIEERDGESTIIYPEGIMEIPGGLRNFN